MDITIFILQMEKPRLRKLKYLFPTECQSKELIPGPIWLHHYYPETVD